jgi:hypothetical protein
VWTLTQLTTPTLPPLNLDDCLVNRRVGERGVHVDCNATRFSAIIEPLNFPSHSALPENVISTNSGRKIRENKVEEFY